MSFSAIFFILAFFIGGVLALVKGPFYGLLLYVHVYFNIPAHQFWGNEVPQWRWSLISALILVLSCIIHRDKLSKISIFRNRIFRLLFIFFLFILITAFNSKFPEVASEKVYDFFRYLVIFVLITQIVTSLKEYEYLLGLVLLECLQLSRLAYHAFHGGRLEGVGPPDAASANQFAGFLALSIPFFLPFLLSKKKYLQIPAFMGLALVINTFIMCGSRGGFLGFIAVLLIIFHFLGRVKLISRKKTILIILVISGVFYGLMSPDYRARLMTLETEPASTASAGRIDIWKASIKMIKDFPLGAGPGAFLELSPRYIPSRFIERNLGKRASHNTYLLVAVEQGVLGLGIFLMIWWYSFKTLIQSSKRSRFFTDVKKLDKNIFSQIELHIVALTASLASLLVTSIFADRLYFEVFYWLLAFVVVLSKLAIEPDVTDSEG